MEGDFFGRDAELLSIGSFLDGLTRGPATLVLAGEAGVGKTTLLRAGSTQAADRGYTRLETMPARSDLRLGFAGLADLLEPCLHVLDELPAPQVRALRVALLLEESPPQPPESRVIAAAFRGVLRTLARSAPVLLVIDDVQWLDPASGAAIGFALRRLEDEPVGLLCAQRTTREDDELPLELGHARQEVTVVHPGGLGPGALHRMLRSRLGTSFPQPTLRRIEAESGGNPFIALEMGRALVRRGVTSLGTSVLPVPGTLAGLVDERLGALSPAVLDALRLVAVRPGASIADYLTAGVGGAELDAAVVAGVLDPDGERLRFAHPLVAAAVAEATPPARRRELHAVAAGIAALPGPRPEARRIAGMRPFRFLATADEYPSFAELASQARKAEAVGCSTFVLPDHLIGQYAVVPLLAMVAAATERLRVGSFVLNVSLRHPAVLAQDLATLDALSGGRLEIGLGAGWNKPEHDAIGIPFEPTGVRIQRLTEAVAVLKGCFAEGPFSFAGEYYTITGHDGVPKPAQRPHPPVFLGGGGKRLLTLAAREAQIIGLAPRLVQGDRPRVDAWSLTAAATEEKIGWIREAAGDRFAELELNTYGTGGPTVITNHPRAEARRRADRIREQTGVELTVEEILDSPHVFIGSIEDLTRKVTDLRERFGISSFLVDDLDALTPLVEQLAGQ